MTEMIRLEIPFVYDGLVREILDEFEWNYQIFFNGNAKMYHEEGTKNPSAEGSFKEGFYENYAYYNFQRFGTIAPTTFPARLEWSESENYIRLECCFDSTKPERMMMLYRLHQESSRQPEDYAEAYLGTCPDLELNWMTAAEATQLWGLGASTIRQAIHEGRLVEGEDVRKSGSTWLVKESAMNKLYGEVKAVTVKQAWCILEDEAIFGSTPEYWAKIENGRIIVHRNYQGSRKYIAKLGGARELAPSPELEDTEWLGFNRDPESIIADNYDQN